MHDDDDDDAADTNTQIRQSSGAVHSRVSLTLDIFGATRTTNTRHR